MSPKEQDPAAEPQDEAVEEPEAEAVPTAEADSVEAPAEDETPAVEWRVHPSAAVGETPVAPEGVDPEFFIGMWAEDKPLYGCPYCSYATIDSPGAVELHILSRIDIFDQDHLAALTPKE